MAAICVYCGSSSTIEPAYVALAREVGAELARRGHDLVSGGARVSMMGAIAAAARAGGARTIGVMPRVLMDWEVGDTDSDELVVVDTMRQRKAEMEARADGFLALPGGLGTLEELFEVWTARSLALHEKPVVVLAPDGFFDPLWTFLDRLVESGFVREKAYRVLTVARSVDEALDAVVPTSPC